MERYIYGGYGHHSAGLLPLSNNTNRPSFIGSSSGSLQLSPSRSFSCLPRSFIHISSRHIDFLRASSASPPASFQDPICIKSKSLSPLLHSSLACFPLPLRHLQRIQSFVVLYGSSHRYHSESWSSFCIESPFSSSCRWIPIQEFPLEAV